MKIRRIGLLFLLLSAFVALSSCIPRVEEGGARVEPPQLGDFFTAGDGEKLSFRAWYPDNPGKTFPPKVVVVAAHGFNDYSNAFNSAARYWAGQGIATYAYDQRGFGGNYPRGIWAGSLAMVSDLKEFTAAVRARHPGVPIYLVGSSMGGSVVISALGGDDPPAVDGAIVLAPGAFGRDVLPFEYNAALWLAAHTIPWHVLTGRGLNRIPSDNIPMLRAVSRDVRVIKGARIDTLYGLVDLMDLALESAPRIKGPLLFLYGEKDDIVRPMATLALLDRIPEDSRKVGVYERGYHMLLRDLQAETVYRDIVSWIFHRDQPLPSGADERGLDNLDLELGP